MKNEAQQVENHRHHHFTRPPAVIVTMLAAAAICLSCHESAHAQVALAGVESGPALVSAAAVPLTGTFRSLTLMQPPFPFNPFPGLPVYVLADGTFIYDDSQVDYVALRAEIAAEATQAKSLQFSSSSVLLGGGGGQVMSLNTPPPPGGGGGGGSGGGISGPPAYSDAGLKVIIQGMTNDTVYLSIADGQAAVPYDFFRTTNQLESSILHSSWSWLGRGSNGLTYSFGSQLTPHSFYVLGTTQNMDGDAWTDAYEQLVSHTDPYGGLPPFNVFITQPSAFSTLP